MNFLSKHRRKRLFDAEKDLLGYALDSPWRVNVAYEYVKSYYGVNPEPGQRVTTKDKQKSGTIVRKKSYDHYVYVTFDGSKFSVPCHPLELEYGK